MDSTQGSPSETRDNPGLNDSIPSGLPEMRCRPSRCQSQNNFGNSGLAFCPLASLLAPDRPTGRVCSSLAPRQRAKFLRLNHRIYFCTVPKELSRGVSAMPARRFKAVSVLQTFGGLGPSTWAFARRTRFARLSYYGLSSLILPVRTARQVLRRSVRFADSLIERFVTRHDGGSRK